MSYVAVDPSFALNWVIEKERNPVSEQLRAEIEAEVFWPITIPLFWYELRSVLIVNERRGKIGQGRTPYLLQDMRLMGIEERRSPSDSAVIRLAYRHGLTGYDASYLALAIEERAILATNDKLLAQTALLEGLELRTMLAL